MTASRSAQHSPWRRRAGTALLAYGLVGVVLLGGLIVALLVTAVRAQGMLERLDVTRDEIVVALDEVDTALRTSEQTLAGVSMSLDETGASLVEAGVLASIISPGTTLLADRADTFDILGRRPFDGLAAPLRDVSSSLSALSDRLDAAGASMRADSPTVSSLGVRLGGVSERLQASRDRLAAYDLSIGAGTVVAVVAAFVLLLWLSVPAIVAIWIGRRWRTGDRRSRAEPDPGHGAGQVSEGS